MNHVRCFDHVISLTAKSVLALFDATNGREHDDSLLDDAEKALMELAEGLEAEEEMARATGSDDSASAPEGEADSISDNTNSIDDIITTLVPAHKLEELCATALPVQTVLVNVCTYQPFSYLVFL